MEAEHYTNGVVEGSTARIMNGTYKHEEILQPDDNSICNGVTGERRFDLYYLVFPAAGRDALCVCVCVACR